MFETLLPASVKVVVAEPWMWSTPVHAEEEATISRAVEKRRREFRAGRHAAHAALRHFDIADYRLLPGIGRAPTWPADMVGAVTHTGEFCAVALAPKSQCLGLGIDAEQNDPLKDDLKPMICTSTEQEWVAAREADGYSWISKLVFSAKESIHKVYYPLNQYTLDFLDAELIIDIHQKCFQARVIKPYEKAPTPIFELEGKFAVDDKHVYSAIYLPQGTR